MSMPLPTFSSSSLRIVCVSDTHNDNPTQQVPDGDIFIHAGDIVDRGSTFEQYTTAIEWISNLPHKLKILTAGNGDVELDRDSDRFKPEILELFTSHVVKSKSVVYLDRETRVVGLIERNGERREIKVYGNPLQPEFSGNKFPFTYQPNPNLDSEHAWATAPDAAAGVQIWVTHGPPLDRLDDANVPGFSGCPVQARKIAESRPLLCVFGHFHYSWGLERVRWDGDSIAEAETEVLTLSEERKSAQGLGDLAVTREFDFSGRDPGYRKAEYGNETIFVNAAWMTTKKRQVEQRNHPIVVTIPL